MPYTIELPSDTEQPDARYSIELPERSTVDKVGRGVGLSARGLIEGALGIPTMALDAGIGIGNLINKGTNWLGITNAAMAPSASSLTDRALTSLGIAEPETGTERVATGVMGAATGAGGAARAAEQLAARSAPGVEKAVLEQMSKGPAMQTAAGASGGAASGVTRELGGGPIAQMAAAFGGGALLPAVQASVAGATRTGLRGAGQQAADNYNTRVGEWQEAGVDPNVGQASGTRTSQALQSTLAKTPGSAGRMAADAQQTATEMQAKVDSIANDLAPRADATKAGLTIEKGLKNFVTRFKGEQDFLYSKLDAEIPKDTRVAVDNTKTALADLNADIPGAPALSEWFKNAKIQGIEGAFKSDTTNPRGIAASAAKDESFFYGEPAPTLPYEAVKKLRSLVGNEITNTNLASAVPRDKWKALYGALSEDMGAAAEQAGPNAQRAFSRANWYTRAGHERIDGILDRVSSKDTPEKTFQAAINPSEVREGSTTANAVLRSLEPEERDVVASAVLRRMGRAKPGQQDEAGGVFSPDTFLTNWNGISDDAKRMLFPDPAARQGVDALTLAASRLREGNKVFANPSGTAGGAASIGAYGGLGAAVATGHPGIAALILAGMGSANISARLMTNQRFVSWVGQTTAVSPAALPAQLELLAQESADWSKTDRQAAQELIGRLRQQAR